MLITCGNVEGKKKRKKKKKLQAHSPTGCHTSQKSFAPQFQGKKTIKATLNTSIK